ncbi:hypothetical protein IKP85_01330 [bacterium]|nr:hypothetical protein [bacterium]
MKKIIAFIVMMLFTSFNASYALSELYLVRNASTDAVKPMVTDGFNTYKYKLSKYDPYYGKSISDSSEYAVVILQQNGANMYYYYQSNGNKKINKAILKDIKRSGYDYEESQNVNIIEVYDRLAQDIMYDTYSSPNRYTFEDTPASGIQINNQSQNQYVQPDNTTLRGAVAQIASGTTLNVYLQSSINTATANKGDQIIAVLMKDVVYNGATVFPQGSLIYGTLTKAVHASYGSRNGKVVIQFNQIVTPDNKSYAITAEKVDFAVTNDGKVKSVVTNAATGAIIGAVGGLIYAALSGGDIGTAAAIGAGVGAGTGLAGSAIERGVDAEIPSFTEMEITLTKPISVNVNY